MRTVITMFVAIFVLFGLETLALAGDPTPMGPTVQITAGDSATVSCEEAYELAADARERQCGGSDGLNSLVEARLLGMESSVKESSALSKANAAELEKLKGIVVNHETRLTKLEARISEIVMQSVPAGGMTRQEVEEVVADAIASMPAPTCDCPEATASSACDCPEGLSEEDVARIVAAAIAAHEKKPHGGGGSGISEERAREIAKEEADKVQPGTTVVDGSAHVASFYGGVYAEGLIGPAMPESSVFAGTGPLGGSLGAAIGWGAEDDNAGYMVLGRAGLSSGSGYGAGGTAFWFGKSGDFAFGGGVGLQGAWLDMYSQRGMESAAGAYHFGGTVDGMLRLEIGNIGFLVVDPFIGVDADVVGELGAAPALRGGLRVFALLGDRR